MVRSAWGCFEVGLGCDEVGFGLMTLKGTPTWPPDYPPRALIEVESAGQKLAGIFR